MLDMDLKDFKNTSRRQVVRGSQRVPESRTGAGRCRSKARCCVLRNLRTKRLCGIPLMGLILMLVQQTGYVLPARHSVRCLVCCQLWLPATTQVISHVMKMPTAPARSHRSSSMNHSHINTHYTTGAAAHPTTCSPAAGTPDTQRTRARHRCRPSCGRSARQGGTLLR